MDNSHDILAELIAMDPISPIATAQLVLNYLIEKKCYEAARIFQDTSPDLHELLEQMFNDEMSIPTLPQSATENSISTDMLLSNILKKQSSINSKNEDLKMKKQLRQERVKKFQERLISEKKRRLATVLGLTENQIQSLRQKKLKNDKIRAKENQIYILKKKLEDISNQLAKLEQSQQISTNNKKVSFDDSNDPGPSTSQSCCKTNKIDRDSAE